MQFIEDFIAEHGIEPAAKKLGLTGQYVGRVSKEGRAIVVIKSRSGYEAFEVSAFGHRHHTPDVKRKAARRLAGRLLSS